MKSASHPDWLTTLWRAAGLLAMVGFVLSGCAPAPEPSGGPRAPMGVGVPDETPEEPPAEQPEVPAEEPDAPEEPAKAPPAEAPAADAELDLAPPVSTFAPAADVAAQWASYVESLEEAVESEEEYNDSVERIAKDANTLILLALALGIHDTDNPDNPYKAAAPAMVKAAQQLAVAADYAAAKAGVEAVKASASATDGDPSALQWDKLASLPELMKAVPLIHNRIKRYMRSEDRLKKAAGQLAGEAAVIAVIAQGSIANAEDTDLPDEADKWHAYCVQMRDAAADVNAKLRAFDQAGGADAFEAVDAAMKDLAQSCDDCHAVFHEEELGKIEE